MTITIVIRIENTYSYITLVAILVIAAVASIPSSSIPWLMQGFGRTRVGGRAEAKIAV